MNITKNMVEDEYLDCLYNELKELKMKLESTKIDAQEAYGRMVSRYDSMKAEASWLANGLLALTKEKEKAISNRLNKKFKVNIGSFVVTQVLIPKEKTTKDNIGNSRKEIVYEDGGIENYRIGYRNSDLSVKNEGETFLMPNSNIALNLIGHSVQDIVEIPINNSTLLLQINSITAPDNDYPVIDIDSLVCLREVGSEDIEDEWYYITETSGGISLSFDNSIDVFVLSINSPLAECIIGYLQGDIVEFCHGKISRKLRVISVE